MLICSRPRISLHNFVASSDWMRYVEYNFASLSGRRKDVKKLPKDLE